MDQWLKIGAIKKLDQVGENIHLTSTSQDLAKDLLQHTENAQSSVLQKGKKRKYTDEYVKYGFSYIGDFDYPKPKCIVCGEIFSNCCMKSSLLLRHLETKHADYKNKECDIFKRLARNNENTSILTSYIKPANKDNQNAIEASYRISYRIAKCGKNHTIAENLIFPCIKDTVQCMFGEENVKKINIIPLSNNTISRRIQDMSENIELTVIDRIKNSNIFAIQVDESTDVTNFAVLLVIARYLNNNKVEENVLLCHLLSEGTTGEDIFNAIDFYFIKMSINWSNCCGLCTDGGKSMSGIYSGLRGRVMKIVPNINWSHCCIHRQSLASKNLPGELKLVLDEAVNEEFFQEAISLSIVEKENLIELSCDTTLKNEFKRKQLINFWVDIRNEYKRLSDKAIEFLLPFISTELVERAFSSYIFIKNKYRNKLNAAPDLRLYLASFEPDIKKLCNLKQGQGSH